MKQSDIYTEALTCLRSILLADHPEFQNWIDWLERDIQDWNQRREVAHHLRAYGGMGSFNDLPSMRGNHDYIFDFLKSVCYAFGHLYGKREGISPEALMEECLHDVEQAAYHPHKSLNQAIAQHLMQGDLQAISSMKKNRVSVCQRQPAIWQKMWMVWKTMNRSVPADIPTHTVPRR